MHKIPTHVRALVLTVISVIAALFIFQAGVLVGYHKASFSARGGERYARMMDGAQAHGATGKIVSVNLPSFVVVGHDNVDKTIIVGAGTVITRSRDTASSSAIQIGDMAFVLGDPDSTGSIQARFIRLMSAVQK